MAKSRAEEVLQRRKRELALGQTALEEPDVSDPEKVKEKEAKARRREARKKEVLKQLLSTTQGREWMCELLVFCHTFTNAFVQNSSDGTGFNLGMQNVGQRLFAEILDVAPDKYTKMLKEAKEREEE